MRCPPDCCGTYDCKCGYSELAEVRVLGMAMFVFAWCQDVEWTRQHVCPLTTELVPAATRHHNYQSSSASASCDLGLDSVELD